MRTTRIHAGMMVFSADGHKLGKVKRVSEAQFDIESGTFFPRDYQARFDEVKETDNDAVYLLHGRASLMELGVPWMNPAHLPRSPGGGSALGPQGRGRMERVHDAIGSWTRPPNSHEEESTLSGRRFPQASETSSSGPDLGAEETDWSFVLTDEDTDARQLGREASTTEGWVPFSGPDQDPFRRA